MKIHNALTRLAASTGDSMSDMLEMRDSAECRDQQLMIDASMALLLHRWTGDERMLDACKVFLAGLSSRVGATIVE